VRRCASVTLALFLAAGIHVDWHLARPLHHRLSLDWQHHWIFAALLFAGIGSVVAARWPGAERWRAAVRVLAWGLMGAQVIEPVLTVGLYEHRLAYVVEPERWVVFFECLAAGVPAYAVALWCVGRWRSPARMV
jgi:hypothetical protein